MGCDFLFGRRQAVAAVAAVAAIAAIAAVAEVAAGEAPLKKAGLSY